MRLPVKRGVPSILLLCRVLFKGLVGKKSKAQSWSTVTGWYSKANENSWRRKMLGAEFKSQPKLESEADNLVSGNVASFSEHRSGPERVGSTA